MKHKTIKKYTVHFDEVTEDVTKKKKKKFKNLLKARTFAREKFRAGLFNRLLNHKKIPLTI